MVTQDAVHKPYLILAEDLYNDPEQTVKEFCAYADIPYKPEALQWDNLGSSFDGQKEWHETKTPKLMQHWHQEAITSTGFEKPRQYKITNGKPTFEEIANPIHKGFAESAYYENLKHYEDLLKNYQDAAKRCAAKK